jgi:hypothetical protein
MKNMHLKNGSEEFAPLVSVTMLSLQSLLKSDPITFYELVMVCRSPDHKVWPPSKEKLAQSSLTGVGGRPHSSVRNIILSAVTGDDAEMSLGNPVEAAHAE